MNYIDQCEQEKLHLSGKIQPHGALIITSREGVIKHLSSNVNALLETSPELSIGDTLPPSLLNTLNLFGDTCLKQNYQTYHTPHQQRFDVTVSRQETTLCLEFTAFIDDSPHKPDYFELPADLGDKSERNLILSHLLQWIQTLTGHERVIYYHFMDNGDGQVVNEVCIDPDMGSYLDLRFPASDIPQIARTLYCQNPWREIPAADKAPLLVLGTDVSSDLTYTDLRSVSPIHRQYMANMGINSSISFPLIKQGDLDALISCHSRHSRKLPLRILRKITRVVSEFNLLQRELDSRNRQELIDEFSRNTHPIQTLLNSDKTLPIIWPELSNQLAHHFKADGTVLCGDGWALVSGITPNKDTLEHLDDWFTNTANERIFWSDNVSGLIPDLPLTEVSGISGIRFQPKGAKIFSDYRLYLCRSEHIHEVSWGGNPNKPEESLHSDDPISPRFSFEKWIEKRLGYSRPWPNTIDIQLHQFRRLLESWKINIGEQP